jgi:hypothetical protein
MPNGPMSHDESAAARTSIARGKAAAKMTGQAQRDYISRQGKVDTYGGGFEPVIRENLLEHGNTKGKIAYSGSMKKGGNVKKTGLYRLHKGEQVIPANEVAAFRKNKLGHRNG